MIHSATLRVCTSSFEPARMNSTKTRANHIITNQSHDPHALTAATATVLSRQKPEEAMSGRCQKYRDGTHLSTSNIGPRIGQMEDQQRTLVDSGAHARYGAFTVERAIDAFCAGGSPAAIYLLAMVYGNVPVRTGVVSRRSADHKGPVIAITSRVRSARRCGHFPPPAALHHMVHRQNRRSAGRRHPPQ